MRQFIAGLSFAVSAPVRWQQQSIFCGGQRDRRENNCGKGQAIKCGREATKVMLTENFLRLRAYCFLDRPKSVLCFPNVSILCLDAFAQFYPTSGSLGSENVSFLFTSYIM